MTSKTVVCPRHHLRWTQSLVSELTGEEETPSKAANQTSGDPSTHPGENGWAHSNFPQGDFWGAICLASDTRLTRLMQLGRRS
jgi:hypothetical protein